MQRVGETSDPHCMLTEGYALVPEDDAQLVAKIALVSFDALTECCEDSHAMPIQVPSSRATRFDYLISVTGSLTASNVANSTLYRPPPCRSTRRKYMF